jgi:hypothetical protein
MKTFFYTVKVNKTIPRILKTFQLFNGKTPPIITIYKTD